MPSSQRFFPPINCFSQCEMILGARGRYARLTVFLAVLSLICGCGRELERSDERSKTNNSNAGLETAVHSVPPSDRPIRAMVTVGMVADLVRQIGGDRVEVTQLMGSGVDPHLFKASRDDHQQILAADICFSSGFMLEGKLSQVLTRLGRTKPVFAVADLAADQGRIVPFRSDSHQDPHVWMDVAAWSECARVITKLLSDFDKANADAYQGRESILLEKLNALHAYGRKCISSIPVENRILVTSHDAFQYFGRAYEIEVLGVQGISTDSEAGLQRINELVDLLVARRIKAVFVESSVPRKNMQALKDGAAARGHQVLFGGELFSDAMGTAGSWEGTYVGMMDHNFTLITKALGGVAPETGMSGQLKQANPRQLP